MRKLILLALAVASGVIVTAAAARTVTIAITRNGFVPKTQAIATGDAVVFANQDTAAHQIALKPTTGFTCSGGLVVQPGQSTTCTFRTAGTYQVTDANNRGSAFKATITVTGQNTPPDRFGLRAVPQVVTYGGTVTVSGAIPTGQANQTVRLEAQECGASAFTAGISATTTANGAFSFQVRPLRNTSYRVRFRNQTSAAVQVRVGPKTSLRKLALRRFAVKVLAAESFAGKAIVFQRYVATSRRWVTVRTVLLKQGPTVSLPLQSTMVSQATFRARVKLRLRVRAVMPQAQVGTCYAPGRSSVVRS